MLRKLLFSAVGSIFSKNTPVAIVVAVLLSVACLRIHDLYRPFKSRTSNHVQACCLIALCCQYFVGMLIKLNAVGGTDSDDTMGVLLVLLLVVVFGVVVCAIGLAVSGVYQKVSFGQFYDVILCPATVTCNTIPKVLEKRKLDAKLEQHPHLFSEELEQHLIKYDDLLFGRVIGQGAHGTGTSIHCSIWSR